MLPTLFLRNKKWNNKYWLCQISGACQGTYSVSQGPQSPGCEGSLAATSVTPLMTRLVELTWLAQWVSSSSSMLHVHPYQRCTLVEEGDLPMEMVLFIGQGYTVALLPARTNLQTSSRFMAINAVTTVSLMILQ